MRRGILLVVCSPEMPMGKHDTADMRHSSSEFIRVNIFNCQARKGWCQARGYTIPWVGAPKREKGFSLEAKAAGQRGSSTW